MGAIDNMNGFYNALDTLVFTASFGEACPNILSEAMLCGTNCVFTAVGDSNTIALPLIYNMRLPGDYEGLASILLQILSSSKSLFSSGSSLRNFTKTYFSLESMALQYKKIWTSNII